MNVTRKYCLQNLAPGSRLGYWQSHALSTMLNRQHGAWGASLSRRAQLRVKPRASLSKNSFPEAVTDAIKRLDHFEVVIHSFEFLT